MLFLLPFSLLFVKEAGNFLSLFFFFTFVQEMLHPQLEYETSALKEHGSEEKKKKAKHRSTQQVLAYEKITCRINNATKITDYDVCGHDNCNACNQNEHMNCGWRSIHNGSSCH